MAPVGNTGRRSSIGVVEHTRLYDERYFRDSDYLPHSGGPAFRQRQAMYRQELRRIVGCIQSGRVLDVGCGFGDFLELFPPSAWERYGIEVAPLASEMLRTRGISTRLPDDPSEFFDLIIFRGTLQHLDEPISMIKRCIGWLRPGGYLVFLATPNIGSVVYRLFQELPALDPPRNFVLVSDRILRQILENLGMEVLRFVFPYIGTPYAHPARDVLSFALRLLGFERSFPFWGNMLECYARKPA